MKNIPIDPFEVLEELEENSPDNPFLFVKLFVSEILRWDKSYSKEDIGTLVVAIAYYLINQPFELPEKLEYAFGIQEDKIKSARRKYKKRYAANAENGRKGGQKKAENARKRLEESGETFKPHTKKAFMDKVKTMLDNYEADCKIGEAEDYFNTLKAQDWKIQGAPFRSKKDVEEAFLYRFPTDPMTGDGYRDYLIFGTLYARGADTTAIGNFFDHYDQDAEVWTINGEEYEEAKDAIEAFLANASKP